MRRRMTAIAAAGCALLALSPATADPGHAGTLTVTPQNPAIDLTDPLHVPIDWRVSNTTGHALTVHGLSSPRADEVRLMRRRSLFGMESYQPVDFLRVEGGESLELVSPDYVLEMDDVADTALTLVLITLDLGPDGSTSVGLVEPLGP